MIISSIVSIFILLWNYGFAQDPSIYGVYGIESVEMTQRDFSLVNSKCFQGIGLITCSPNLPNDDTSLGYDLDYYKDLGSIQGSNYCLQCCGKPPDNIDTWDLSCPATKVDLVGVNLFEYELRLARRQTLQDAEIIKCPLKRSICTYTDTNELIGCNRTNHDPYLIGVKVTINVRQYNDKFTYWNGVSSCEIEATETFESIDVGHTYVFDEKIILVHEPLGPLELANDPTKILVIIFVLLFVIFICLRFCRRKHCPYCQKKLLISLNLCVYCQLVGAEMPDPVLLKALEEKTAHAQGQIPERFPGARVCIDSLRPLIKLICCIRPYSVVKILPVVDDATVATKVGDGVVTEFVSGGDEESKEPVDQQQQTPKPKTNKSILKNNTLMNASSGVKKGKPKKEKPRNPNILDYPEDIIYKAVKHPYPPDGDKKV